MDHELGCCGYDELEYKPPTTRPIGRAGVRAAIVDFGRRNSYRIGNVGMSGFWYCPECSKLHWTVEDRGHGEHYGIAKNLGQTVPPRCLRHPHVTMVLKP